MYLSILCVQGHRRGHPEANGGRELVRGAQRCTLRGTIGISRVIDTDAVGVLMGSTPALVHFTAASQTRRASAFEDRRRVKQ